MESKVYRMRGASFAVEMMFRYSGIWLLGLFVLALLGIILGVTVDLRILVVGLMVIFVVFPMVLAFLYYYFGLRKECFINTIPHSLLITDDGLTVRMFFYPDNKGQDGDVVEESSDNNESSDTDVIPQIREEFFSYSQMLPYRIGSKSVTIPLRSPAKGFIWIPADAFDDNAELASALELIDTRIRQFHSE